MKKSIIKRIISFMLVILLLIAGIPVNSAYADTTEDIINIAADILQVVLESPADYGFDSTSASYSITEAITPYKYNEYGLLEAITGKHYYFIYSGNKPVAALICSDTTTGYWFETDIAKELAAFNSDKFTVICSENGTHISSTVYNISPVFCINKIEISMQSTYAMPSSYNLPIPIIQQYGDGSCWAACVASVGKYFTGITKTARQVCDAMGIGYDAGGNAYEIKDAVTTIYGLSAKKEEGFQKLSGVYTLLSFNRVPIALWFTLDGKNAHAVVVRGYNASTQGAYLSVMDPNSSSYCIIYESLLNGDAVWSFTYDVGEFYWVRSIMVSEL